ncbi:hypothetical protein AB0C69_26150 [Actinomadura sp. NPDC048032]|uniref:hypothetical protein n=1 Tax=Actinomadura sp. NPDC048032 TaxID=3155747 RepID=UPI0033E44E37
MRANLAIFSTPKDGSTEEEYEDAACCLPEPTNEGEVSADLLRVAVADGASESLLANRWARLLTHEFTNSQISAVLRPHEFAAASLAAATTWDETMAAYVDERVARGKPIMWYEQPGFDRGAYATLIAVCFGDADSGRSGADHAHNPHDSGGHGASANDQLMPWHAAAIGDSCLFQVRDDRLAKAFPMDASMQFGTNPDLLCSRGLDERLVADRARFDSGACQEGDTFFLCTDALAAWFLSRYEAGHSPWAELTDLGSAEIPAFSEWVAAQRSAGLMRNDDVTLVRVDIW